MTNPERVGRSPGRGGGLSLRWPDRLHRGPGRFRLLWGLTVDASPKAHRRPRYGGPAAPAEPAAPRPLPGGPYELRLANLRTRWPGGEIIGFEGADLILPPGRRAALLGRGRVGTSALAAVLIGFLDYQGTATLNEVQLRDLAGEDVRKVIGFCAQDAHVFAGTLAENVRAARPDAGDDDVAGALHRAGVERPAGARVDERTLAGPCAERQRIALARALLADLPVLVVDEPDADGDDAAADALLGGMFDAAEGRTLLMIMHRELVPGGAPILRRVDEVVSLDRVRPG